MEHLEEIIRSARKEAEQAEVFSLASRTVSVQFEANELKQVQTKESSSIALRIFKEGRIGFAIASGEGSLDALVDMAVETSQFGSPANFQFPSRFHRDSSKVCIFDSKVGDLAKGRMIDIGKELITKIRGHSPDILCDVQVTKGTSSISIINSQGGEGRYDNIINSQGGEGRYDKSFFGFSLEGVLVRDTDMLFVGDSESSCRPDFIGTDDLVGRVIWQLEAAKKKATVPTKLLPVIFTPLGVAGVLISPIMMAFNGKTVIEGASPLKDKRGKQVFDKKLSLWDDATVAYGVGSYPFDDEGVSSQRISLVTNGIVTNFLYDLQTAALAGTQSTGNGRRGGGGFPSPAISSLILNGGDVSFQAMVEDMKEGLIVEEVIGADQGNILGGDFGGFWVVTSVATFYWDTR